MTRVRNGPLVGAAAGCTCCCGGHELAEEERAGCARLHACLLGPCGCAFSARPLPRPLSQLRPNRVGPARCPSVATSCRLRGAGGGGARRQGGTEEYGRFPPLPLLSHPIRRALPAAFCLRALPARQEKRDKKDDGTRRRNLRASALQPKALSAVPGRAAQRVSNKKQCQSISERNTHLCSLSYGHWFVIGSAGEVVIPASGSGSSRAGNANQPQPQAAAKQRRAEREREQRTRQKGALRTLCLSLHCSLTLLCATAPLLADSSGGCLRVGYFRCGVD
jgi:hypothetical protein